MSTSDSSPTFVIFRPLGPVLLRSREERRNFTPRPFNEGIIKGKQGM